MWRFRDCEPDCETVLWCGQVRAGSDGLLPWHVRTPGGRIGSPGKHEEEVGQAIEIGQQDQGNLFRDLTQQGDKAPLRSTADGPCQVQICCRRAPPRKDEISQGRECLVDPVYVRLEDLDVLAFESWHFKLTGIGGRDLRPQSKQLILDTLYDRVDFARERMGACEAEDCVEFVEGTDQLDSRHVLANSRAAE